MAVQFTDNSKTVKDAINAEITAWLHEQSSEIASQAKRNCSGDYGDRLRGSYQNTVWTTEATIGSPMEESLWEEFGTGEYAVNGDGKKGWWVYVDGMNNHAAKSRSREDAVSLAKSMQAQGIPAHATNGNHPHKTLENAYDKVKPKAIKDLEDRMKGVGG